LLAVETQGSGATRRACDTKTVVTAARGQNRFELPRVVTGGKQETVTTASQIPVLSASSINKSFNALVVLNQVNFVVGEREAVGIVGPNGAGKTTLLNVLAGAYQPSAGTVAFRGQDITDLPVEDRCRKGIARSHQIPRPFGGMTVFENLFVAAANGGGFRRDEAYDRCIDALKLCGMVKLANRRAEALGLLDRKRLELARAIATDPVVLLLDEIGGGLTDAEASELVETIQIIRRRDVAIVWIEHIVHVLLQVSERLVCMNAGTILADGDPQKVMSDRTVIDAYLGGSVE
jgi:branched-chain amino acid transport system ATP-binding protein